VVLTPEEWVRQNFALYLTQTLHYPASLIAIEKEIRVGELSKRFDILVYNHDHHPWLMVECKAPEILLKDEVLHQVLRYAITLPVSFLVITNGNQTLGWMKADGKLHPMETLPAI